ncbi:MAG TPA: tyrosine--tRNA ligase, partial [Candidatus Moranbacteria bacterium]|nr:tyrosine--tRNA ligase [Candidatus Moranbacteria bacterium]
FKLRLAFEITKINHGESEAEKAKEYFVNTFSKKEIPVEIGEVRVEKESISLIDFIVLSGNAKSKGDARRKIEQGGVEINQQKETDWQRVLHKKDDESMIKVGKIHFVKIKFE